MMLVCNELLRATGYNRIFSQESEDKDFIKFRLWVEDLSLFALKSSLHTNIILVLGVVAKYLESIQFDFQVERS